MEGVESAMGTFNATTIIIKMVLIGFIGLSLWQPQRAKDALGAISGLLVVVTFVFGKSLSAVRARIFAPSA